MEIPKTEPLPTITKMKNEMDPLVELENFFSETLRETLEEIDIHQSEVARCTGIPRQHLSEMKLGKRRCTSEYDLRLSRYFGTTPGFWMGLQLDYEMRLVKREKGEEITAQISPLIQAG